MTRKITPIYFISAMLLVGCLEVWADPKSGTGETEKLAPEEKLQRFKSKTAEELIQQLREQPNNKMVTHRLRKLRAKKAIPVLKEALGRATKSDDKRVLAATMVALGEEEAALWDQVALPAIEAIKRDIPFPVVPGQKERRVEFLAWCDKNQVKPERAAVLAASDDPADVMFLAFAENQKAVPIFMTGLKARNPMIVIYSAKGLARLMHKPAIKDIAQAARRVGGSSVAETLFLFGESQAESLAEELIQDKKITAFLKGMSLEKRHEFLLGE